MAKKKSNKVIDSVSLKDEDQVIEIEKMGIRVTKDNLNVDRYRMLVNLSSHYEQFFNVKLITPKQDEMESKG